MALFTVKVCVAVFTQPPEVVTEYVIVEVPDETPKISPEVELIVATPVFEEKKVAVIGDAPVAEADKLVVPEIHTADVPEIAPATGFAFTVIVRAGEVVGQELPSVTV